MKNKQAKPATIAAVAAPKPAATEEKRYLEEYEVTREELLEVRFINERVGKLRAELGQAETQARDLLQRLGVKYLEAGAYRGIDPLNLETGKGTRVRAR